MNKLFQLGALSLLIFSCEKNPSSIHNEAKLSLPTNVFDYQKLPDNFENVFSLPLKDQILHGGNKIDNNQGTVANPAITNHGATLGRVLFYDKKLSLNNTIACGSCHHQANGFADPVAFSNGFENLKTLRNSSSISNAAISDALFWDSRAPSVKTMTLNPIQNHIEMGMEDLNYLEQKLSKLNYYPELFRLAYGSEQITSERISDAIAQFVCSLVSSQSKNDFVNPLSSSSSLSLSALENMGKSLFNSSKTNCSVCHGGANMVSNGYENSTAGSLRGTANIGLDAFDKDKGFIKGTVKIPSLRNVSVSGPYMHDGRFNTLLDVVEHYNSGIQNNKNLDSRLRDTNGSPKKLGLSDIEKESLVAFLKTLTDEKFLKDERFSDPFIK